MSNKPLVPLIELGPGIVLTDPEKVIKAPFWVVQSPDGRTCYYDQDPTFWSELGVLHAFAQELDKTFPFGQAKPEPKKDRCAAAMEGLTRWYSCDLPEGHAGLHKTNGATVIPPG